MSAQRSSKIAGSLRALTSSELQELAVVCTQLSKESAALHQNYDRSVKSLTETSISRDEMSQREHPVLNDKNELLLVGSQVLTDRSTLGDQAPHQADAPSIHAASTSARDQDHSSTAFSLDARLSTTFTLEATERAYTLVGQRPPIQPERPQFEPPIKVEHNPPMDELPYVPLAERLQQHQQQEIEISAQVNPDSDPPSPLEELYDSPWSLPQKSLVSSPLQRLQASEDELPILTSAHVAPEPLRSRPRFPWLVMVLVCVLSVIAGVIIAQFLP